MPLHKVLIEHNLSPAHIYEKIRHLPFPVLLESAMKHPDIGRYSFVAADPFLVMEVKKGACFINGTPHQGDPLVLLDGLIRQYQLSPAPDLPPFTGGAVGFFSYDFGWLFENLPDRTLDDVKTPDCMFCFYDTVFALDHEKNSLVICSSGFPELFEEKQRLRREKRARYFQKLLSRTEEAELPAFPVPAEMKCHFDQESYCAALKKVIDYILAGDIYQVNMTQRFSLPFAGSPFHLYRKLAHINPAPFAALLEWKAFAVVSASPERYLRVQDRQVETRPIKGTRPRGKTGEEDRQLRDELWNSAKDRAELTMIVDLERNDLGRVCIPGSVKVPELFRLEQYATVWHLVSTVEGNLKPGMTIFDVIKHSFPGGSITGAPKIRAMEIIEELEPVKRGIYTGSIGYIGFNGACDLNIVIRTFIIKDGMAHIQVGGGITADSDPPAEYQETLDKAKALFQSLGLSGGKKDESLA
ncbi:aminodeoxychorismate synthase component I [Candidatus Formimonas warabiya]|uniref:Anthranilate synthase component 1 n=1 Tax=Formimonas warabiya TaxID=1761012 RepID=A0A3G1KRQ2_FORW1|nr:aminodeoxychorismate synthase component I [Candidatus Formimonas warabiya]ATW25141.1 aminodeoxychorismate synthase, component I [Candidatus Formimonas warabiya]